MQTIYSNDALLSGRTSRGLVYADELVVDETDPFFFDHPVDHVPGILLLDGLLVLAEQALNETEATTAHRYIAELRLEFARFAEKTAGIRLQARVGEPEEQGRRCDLLASQEGVPLCRGRVEFRRVAPTVAARLARSSPVPQAPAPAEAVHKRHRHNIFISGLYRDAAQACRTRLLPLAPGHGLHARQRDRRTVLELVEAGRQFALLMQHEVHATPAGRPFILESIEACFQRAFSREADLEMVSTDGRPASSGKASQSIELLDGDARVGELRFGGRAVSPRLYARIRQASRQPNREGRP